MSARSWQRRAARLTQAEADGAPDSRCRPPTAAIKRCSNTRGNSTASRRERPQCPRCELSRGARSSFRRPFAPLVDSRLRQHPRLRRSARCRANGRRECAPGLRAGQIVRPLDTVAAYIPAGRYPLPSTVMMTVDSRAGGRRAQHLRRLAQPVRQRSSGPPPCSGVHHVFQMGGAQAIAAFAYGTETVPRADRIVGPGNIYVAAAKKLLAGEVGIDFVAGPTEILIIAAEGDPRHLAADMLAQAEHDVDASAVLLTTSKRLAAAVAKRSSGSWRRLPTAAVARKSIARNSAIILVRLARRGHRNLANRFAPEHLSIPDRIPAAENPARRQRLHRPVQPRGRGRLRLRPQSRAAHQRRRAPPRRPFRCRTIVKVISVQELQRKRWQKLAPAITTLARAEGLEAHARSVEVRTS